MKDRFFIDTNIFVYSFDDKNEAKRDKSRELITDALSTDLGVISHQVVQEFINVATRKFLVPLTFEDCRSYVEKIMFPLWDVSSNKQLVLDALEIQHRWNYGFYDSMIVAAAIQSNCSKLYSEDLQSGQKIYSLEIVNPF